MTVLNVGDKVRIIEVSSVSIGEYHIGDIFTVSNVGNLGVIAVNDRLTLFAHEYEVLAND